jgi:hypothetical protein
MARFRFARGTLADGFSATDTVESRAELVARIRRNIVYLRDLDEPNLIIAPSYGRDARSGVITTTLTYVVQAKGYGVVGFLDGQIGR